MSRYTYHKRLYETYSEMLIELEYIRIYLTEIPYLSSPSSLAIPWGSGIHRLLKIASLEHPSFQKTYILRQVVLMDLKWCMRKNRWCHSHRLHKISHLVKDIAGFMERHGGDNFELEAYTFMADDIHSFESDLFRLDDRKNLGDEAFHRRMRYVTQLVFGRRDKIVSVIRKASYHNTRAGHNQELNSILSLYHHLCYDITSLFGIGDPLVGRLFLRYAKAGGDEDISRVMDELYNEISELVRGEARCTDLGIWPKRSGEFWSHCYKLVDNHV